MAQAAAPLGTATATPSSSGPPAPLASDTAAAGNGPSLVKRTLISVVRGLTGIKFDRPPLAPMTELTLGGAHKGPVYGHAQAHGATVRHHSTAANNNNGNNNSTTATTPNNTDGVSTQRDHSAANAINPGFRQHHGNGSNPPPQQQTTTTNNNSNNNSTSPGSGGAGEEASSRVRLARDIPYVAGGGGYVNARGFSKQSLDIYCPPQDQVNGHAATGTGTGNGNGLLPVIVHFHGGSWRRGDRSIPFYGSPGFGQGLAARGVIVVAPSYRLGNSAHIKEDAVAAVEWTAANIERFGGDPARIIVSGHSAGGNISASLATNPSWLPGPTRAGNVAGFLAISGVYNMMQPFATGLGAGWSLGAKNALFRHVNLWSERTRWLASDVGSVLNFSPGARVEQTLRQHERDEQLRQRQQEEAGMGSPGQQRQQQGGRGWWGSLTTALSSSGGGPADEPDAAPALAVPTGFDAGEMAAADPASFDRLLTVDELRSKPLLVLNGGSDLGLEHDGRRFAGMLDSLGVPMAYHTLEGADHASVMWDERMFDLVAQYARTAVPPPAPSASAASNGDALASA